LELIEEVKALPCLSQFTFAEDWPPLAKPTRETIDYEREELCEEKVLQKMRLKKHHRKNKRH
jgi:hypothetical protein